MSGVIMAPGGARRGTSVLMRRGDAPELLDPG